MEALVLKNGSMTDGRCPSKKSQHHMILLNHGEGEGPRAAEIQSEIKLLAQHRKEVKDRLEHGVAFTSSVY
jgi:hypothetical protein